VNIVKAGPPDFAGYRASPIRFAGRGPSKGKSDLAHLRGPRTAARGPVFYNPHDIKGTLVPLAARDIHDIHGIHGI